MVQFKISMRIIYYNFKNIFCGVTVSKKKYFAELRCLVKKKKICLTFYSELGFRSNNLPMEKRFKITINIYWLICQFSENQTYKINKFLLNLRYKSH